MRVLDRPEPSDLDAPAVAPPGRGIRYMPALDGLRALAVIAVLLFHGGVLTGGYLGVDAFFVLSGFLITSLIVSEVHSHGRLGLGAFWGRRARRLLPALFCALFGVALYAVVFANPNELARIRGDEFATLFYVANWHAIFAGHGYWSLFQAPSPLEHAWSLAIEEQFYLVWPLVMAGVAALVVRRARRTGRNHGVAPTVFVIAVVSAALSAVWCMVLYDPTDTSRAYLGTDTRIAAILIGAAFAAWMAWRGPVKSHAARIALEVIAGLAIVGLAVAWTRLDGQSEFLYRGGLLLCGLAVMLVVAAAAHPTAGPIAHALSWRPLVAIGLISYGLYLWHWPVYLVLTPDRMGFGGNALLAVRIAASFAIAITSYFLIEKPIRHGALSRRTLTVVTPAVLIACIAAILITTAGATTLPTAGKQFITTTGGTDGSARALAAAHQAAAGASSRLLFVGDSVGVQVGQAAVNESVGGDHAVVAGAIAGCVLTAGTGGYQATTKDRTFVVPDLHECTDGWFATADAVKPTDVMIIYGTGASFLNVNVDGQWVGPCDAPYQNWYDQQLRNIIAKFKSDGATSVELLRLPYPTADFLADTARARIACLNTVHARVAREVPGVELLDLAAELCPNGVCPDQLAGATMRTDGLHFDPGPPADYVAAWLLDQVGSPRR